MLINKSRGLVPREFLVFAVKEVRAVAGEIHAEAAESADGEASVTLEELVRGRLVQDAAVQRGREGRALAGVDPCLDEDVLQVVEPVLLVAVVALDGERVKCVEL